ncbi:MAG: 3-deoxy-manno-octulosonate cytidylyltransferase [Candidatus Buchananbacteria bacterium]|nr:3-deoxy-manno-octulosonate cytidylyltransferase [Candidatus Buchananbacteria bacterium]
MKLKKKLKIIAVIPARYQSSRLPGKPLALIDGKPMIQWVYERTKAFIDFEDVIVATDDRRIFDTVSAFGGKVEMTSPGHLTGTDRVAEVAARHPDADVVVNVQGDHPFVDNSLFERLIAPYFMYNPPAVVTLASPLVLSDFTNDNVVKIVCDNRGRAISLTRTLISTDQYRASRHIGLYAFRAKSLRIYTTLKQKPLELERHIEILRFLEYGYPVLAIRVEDAGLAVDTPHDLIAANDFAKQVKTKTIKRIICCQSTHGLLAALAAAKFIESKTTDRVEYVNYLVVYGLTWRLDLDARDQEVFLMIKQMAQAVMPWAAVAYLSNRTFTEALTKDSTVNLTQLIYSIVGTESANEVYLCRNRDFFGSRLLQAYNSATKVCYGDGLGIYHDQDVVTHEYYRESIMQSLVTFRWWRLLKLLIRWVDVSLIDRERFQNLTSGYPILNKAKIRPYYRYAFDFGCYLFPDGMGFGSGDTIRKYQLSPDIFVKLIDMIAQSFDYSFLADLKNKMIGRNVVVFLLTDFSPGRELQLADEIAAYGEFLDKKVDKKSLVLLKVHPKTEQYKIDKLKTFFMQKHPDVMMIDYRQFLYMPFEIVFQALFADLLAQKKCRVQLVAFRTSTLGVAKIFGVSSAIGFGSQLVLKYFNKSNILHRLWEEHLTKKALQKIMESR